MIASMNAAENREVVTVDIEGDYDYFHLVTDISHRRSEWKGLSAGICGLIAGRKTLSQVKEGIVWDNRS